MYSWLSSGQTRLNHNSISYHVSVLMLPTFSSQISIRVFLHSAAGDNRKRPSLIQKQSFTLWSWSGEVLAHALEYNTLHRLLLVGCFIRFSSAGRMEVCSAGVVLTALQTEVPQRVCTPSAKAILNWGAMGSTSCS